MRYLRLNILLIVGVLYCFSLSFAQESNEKLDSLERLLSKMDKKQPDEIIKLGNYILENSKSEEQKSKVFGYLAVIYFEKNDLKKSTELFFEAKKAAEKTNNHELIAKIYGSIAHQYIHLKMKDKAKFYLNKAIDRIDKIPEGNNKHFLKGLSYLELGNLEFDNQKYVSANKVYKQSLRQFQQMIEPGKQVVYHYRRSLYNIGNSYFHINQLDSAEFYLNKTLQIRDETNLDLNYFIYNTLSQIYSQRGLYKRAIDSMEVVLNDRNFKDPRLRSEIYLNLSRNYRKLGDNEKYFIYNEKHIQLKDSLQLTGLNAISAAMDAEQKEFAEALSVADKNKEFLLIIGILSFAVLLTVIFYLVIKRKKERKLFERLIEELKQNPKESQIQQADLEINEKSDTVSIPVLVEEELLAKLNKFEKSNKFTNPKLSISTLAVQLKTNTTYLSEVINKHKGKNFNAYINELRIKYICEKIYKNSEYLNYKISYLAEESGFTSHSTFATVFKSVTGISPSVFLREAAKIESYKPKSNYLVK